jgi:hypothetical protein
MKLDKERKEKVKIQVHAVHVLFFTANLPDEHLSPACNTKCMKWITTLSCRLIIIIMARSPPRV